MNMRKFKLNTDYRKKIAFDERFNVAFRGKMTKEFKKGYEWKFICLYRKYQANKNNYWGRFFLRQLRKLENKTGFSFEGNTSIGDGIIIGHWGKIVINAQVQFGSYLFLTHGVTVGRDVRGKRAGVPTIGDRVCIRTNSTVVGNIKD